MGQRRGGMGMRRPGMHRSGVDRGGFTLVELMVVIGIVGIVGGLLPVARGCTVLRWGMGSDSGVEWALILPTMGYLAGGVKAMLLKTLDAGANWGLMDQIDYAPRTVNIGFFLSAVRVRHWVENGTAVFVIGGVAQEWRFRDLTEPNGRGYVAPEGRFEVSWFGGAGHWCLNRMIHRKPTGGGRRLGAATTAPLTAPSWVTHDSTARSVRLVPANPDTPDVTVSAVVNDLTTSQQQQLKAPDGYTVTVAFDQTNSGARKGGDVVTPVVFAVQEIRRAQLEQVGALRGDLAVDAVRVTWEQDRGMRDCRMTIRAKNDTGQWDFLRGNELVLLDVAKLVTGAGGQITPEPVTDTDRVAQCGGFVVKVDWKRDLDWNGSKGWVDISTRGWEFRLRKKPCRNLPAFAGWDAREACELVLHQSGLLDEYFDFSAMPYGTWMLSGAAAAVGGKGKVGFAYTARHNVIMALDEMLASVGWSWSQGPDMVIRPHYVLGALADSSYTLDETNYDPEVDCIQELSLGVDLEDLCNVVQVSSVQVDGLVRTVIKSDPKSIYGEYGVDANYVGDDWWDIHEIGPGIDPDSQARGRLVGRASYNQVVSWRTDLQLAVQPRTNVTVNVENSGIPHGTKFTVMRRRGTLEFTESEFRGEMEFMMGRPVLAGAGAPA